MENKVSEQEKEIAELKYWKETEIKLWGPVIDYAQTHPEELGLTAGDSISIKVLFILKERVELRRKVIVLGDSRLLVSDVIDYLNSLKTK